MISYLFEIQAQTISIKQIKLQSKFNFTSQNKVSLAGITPIGKIGMNFLKK